MMGDCHVRFRERLGVKFPLPTRPPSVVSNARKHPANIKLILIKVNNYLPLGR